MKSIQNITNALIVFYTILEDSLIDDTSNLSQVDLNDIYIFVCEVEHLNKILLADLGGKLIWLI